MNPNFRFKISGGDVLEERSVVLTEGVPFKVGRQESGLQLLDPSISRNHCSFVFENLKVFVVDSGSTNGTFVVGQQIARQEVFKGNLIQFGIYKLEILQTPLDVATAEPLFKKEIRAEMNAKPRSQLNSDFNLSLNQLKKFIVDATTDTPGFFERTSFTGDPKFSIQVISLCFLLSNSMSVLRISFSALWSNSGPTILFRLMIGTMLMIVLSTILTVLQVVAFSFVLETLRTFIGSDGRFEQYLRFFMYASVLALVGTLISTLTLGFLAPFVTVALFIWSVYGLLKAFEPKPFHFLAVLTVFGILSGLLHSGLYRLLSPLLYLNARI